jgi:cellulose biosynthesis protein BcsQ
VFRLSIVSAKGGVGKSTLSYYLGKEFSESRRVLIVSIDGSRTLNEVFNVNGSLLDGSDFYYEKGNLSFISFSNTWKDVNIEDIEEIYSNYLDTDIIIVDNPVHLSKDVILEYTVFSRICKSKNYILGISSPQSFVISVTKNFLKEYSTELSANFNEIGIVINFFRGDKIDEYTAYGRIFTLPFIKELLYKGFWNIETPKEFKSLSKLILNILENEG